MPNGVSSVAVMRLSAYWNLPGRPVADGQPGDR
jgi:hypothetical protein